MKHGEDPVRAHHMDRLRVIGSTGEPWNPDPWRWCFEVVGGGRVPILNYSGGTEISGGILCGNLHTPSNPAPSASGPRHGGGRRRPRGQPPPRRGRRAGPAPALARHDPGLLEGPPALPDTYWSRWPGLWYHGDWAEVDADGLWYILGRSDDTIKVAGKRVGPAEVESALVAHPAVQEAAAIGVPTSSRARA